MKDKIIKATLRIPTAYTYAYIEIVLEGTAKEIIEQYLQITSQYRSMQAEFDKKEKLDAPPF